MIIFMSLIVILAFISNLFSYEFSLFEVVKGGEKFCLLVLFMVSLLMISLLMLIVSYVEKTLHVYVSCVFLL